MKESSRRVLVMGVSGSGKSHVGQRLAERLGAHFIDGDDHHSPANVAKMAGGMPLNDDDRREWLDTLAMIFERCQRLDTSVVIACSALKKRYRERLREGDPALVTLYLNGEPDLLRTRLAHRPRHFFKGDDMLNSQLADLEPPGEDEALAVSITISPEEIVERFVSLSQ